MFIYHFLNLLFFKLNNHYFFTGNENINSLQKKNKIHNYDDFRNIS